jgi:hypothetical protein
MPFQYAGTLWPVNSFIVQIKIIRKPVPPSNCFYMKTVVISLEHNLLKRH